ncbi:hypothetical protein, partial [Paraconexibacter sp.]|uniref:hypothetical protein n=1 Tax=Paraconexibacter sp. TaxID=2949640 RepID=UPI00356A4A20
MGRRSRKAGRVPGDAQAAPRRLPPSAEETRAADPAVAYADRQARTEARNAELRAKLVPLAPDEHPRPLKAAMVTCVVLAAANVALALSGYEIASEDGSSSSNYVGVTLFSIILLIAAVGMYKHRYWAILG